MPVTETRYSEEELKKVLAAYELAMYGRRLTGLRLVVTPVCDSTDQPTGGYSVVAVVESEQGAGAAALAPRKEAPADVPVRAERTGPDQG